ncbi:hypothetical protein ACUXAV_004874 [Cupriavidus metallidurans]|jgi:hypothetical protein|uniref:Uncharacterized protein n=3 Tax=Cupriavidus TaxID=106589 RepID=A0A3G8GUS0_9BURK|nr:MULTISPECIES: hypothetical protein [Cupriavidus]AVA38020.1 hypothetical protein C3Z06_30880 [Cupriavidus metallidurans]AZG11987.1 hypothetical protein EHF44_00420 [Cupriavidus pauculus]MDE4922738.1 hypothetical protein [Cupriavidus metallidurans]MWL91648.1 hypothetical protein [Cupriavidus sp. SW-Y-13]QBP14510.1 hypothetical protein DDF84_032930 [Cupriavidus metallidurans]
MTTATHNILTPSNIRDLTIFGFYPSGQKFSGTVKAGSSFEAMIRVLADRRYSDDGGDLAVSSVIDAETGRVVDGALLSAQHDLLPEVEAIEGVVQCVTDLISTMQPRMDGDLSDRDRLFAYTEYVGLLLAEAPLAFEGLTHGAMEMSDENMTLEFEDCRGHVHYFEPAFALLTLAEAALQVEVTTAALQVKTLATVARSSLNLAAIDAL